MDKLLKHVIDNDAVGFITRMKDKMNIHHNEAREGINRQVAADIAGTEVVQEYKDIKAFDKKSIPKNRRPLSQHASNKVPHVFVYASGKGIKWRTSDQRTGGEANFKDQKDEKKLRAYFQKVFGKKKEFTLEIRESDDTTEV
jgi:hypothetical protein